jgi:hypothetical protein
MALIDIPTDKIADALREGEQASAAEVSSRDVKIRESVAARSDAPLSVLIHLAQDAKTSVRVALASNPVIATMVSVIDLLAADKEQDVLLALVNNPAIPVTRLSPLSAHSKKRVRQAFEARFTEA